MELPELFQVEWVAISGEFMVKRSAILACLFGALG